MFNQVLDNIADLLRLDYGFLARRGLQVVGILVLAMVAYRLLSMFTRRLERVVEDQDLASRTAREQRARTIAQLINSVGAVAIFVGAGLTVLNFFFPIAPLLAGVGVAGLAISFGAQSLVKDVISGFFMLVENQLSVGDIVNVGDGASGVVERMTMRVVMVRDVNGVLHIVPNGSITRVSNLTRDWARTVVDVGVGYQEDVDRVIKVMREIGVEFNKDAEWRSQLVDEPAVWGVESFAENAVNVRIIANTLPGKQWGVGRELRRRIKNRFDEEGIRIPHPQRTVHVGDDVNGLLQQLSKARPARPPRK